MFGLKMLFENNLHKRQFIYSNFNVRSVGLNYLDWEFHELY